MQGQDSSVTIFAASQSTGSSISIGEKYRPIIHKLLIFLLQMRDFYHAYIMIFYFM